MIQSNGKVSLYIQIKQKIRERIETNEWKSGTKIPGEHELAALFGVSRATLRKALDDLERDGFVTRRAGDGTYVCVPKIDQRLGAFYSFSTEVRALGMAAATEVLEFALLYAEPMLQAKLRLSGESLIYRIRRLRLADGIPFALETSCVPQTLCSHLTQELVERYGLYEAMEKSAELHPDEAQESFEAVLMTREDAALLRCPLPSAALHLERITTANGVPVEYCNSIVRGDRYQYHVYLRQNERKKI